MKVESVEWSMGKPPDSVVEIWSVAATMEAILLILAVDNREAMAAFLAKPRQSGTESEGDAPTARRPPKRRRQAASK